MARIARQAEVVAGRCLLQCFWRGMDIGEVTAAPVAAGGGSAGAARKAAAPDRYFSVELWEQENYRSRPRDGYLIERRPVVRASTGKKKSPT